MANEIVSYTVNDMEKMAVAIAKSGLFGMKTAEQALALMCVSQAEGLHPAIAARDYHIIQGRPTLKADAMLARFQTAGGKVEWHTYTDECCDATISHPQGGTVRVMWDMDRVKKAEIKNIDMYKKYPRNMLRARVISEGIRTVYPGVVVGTYTPEEAEEFTPPKSPLAQWAETPPPVIEHQPKPEKDELSEQWGAFTDKLHTFTKKDQLTSFVARNNTALFNLKNERQELFEKVSIAINQANEAFDMAEAAE